MDSKNRARGLKTRLCVCNPVTELLKEAGEDMERINKETGELSASGDLAESTELKRDNGESEPAREEDTHSDSDAVVALRQQLLQLTQTAAEHREQQLDLLLPLFLQVQKVIMK